MDSTFITIILVGGICFLLYWLARRLILGLYRRIKPSETNPTKPKAQSPEIASTPAKHSPQHVTAGQILSLLIVAGFIWYFFGGGWEKHVAKNTRDIEKQIAADIAAQYGIAQRNGTAVDRCVQAGAAALAFMQAQNEAAYNKWKRIEESECTTAGLR